MTLGIFIMGSLVVVALAGAWHINVLFEAIRGMLVFLHNLEGRVNALELGHEPPPWQEPRGDGDGGPHT